ncbi:hypothetical protein L9F63_006301 [Diploptera punctata]|uniref:Asn/Gln amidotransferase domain-containing protein n=1 Tax=Diploptera punctata TaxID=6984 RepID=A0AAD7ZAK2_DIPPU|nr:hypothetical protein L9F63_006301 [Diploptera punctata]
MRDKEEKQDYRFMPEPNLPPLRLIMDSDDTRCRVNENLVNVSELRNQLPELPAETRKRLVSQFGLSQEIAIRLVNENALLEHFNSIMKENENRNSKLTANILINELLTVLNKNKLPFETRMSSQSLGEIVDLLTKIVIGNPNSPSKLVEMLGLFQISDISEIEKICAEVLKQNPKMVEQFLSGKTKVFNSLVGTVAKTTNNRANMGVVVEVLTNKLNNMKSLKKHV